MQTRLLAYGCSNTFGEGLDDIWHHDPSLKYGRGTIQVAMPGLRLGKLRIMESIIMRGASNKKMS